MFCRYRSLCSSRYEARTYSNLDVVPVTTEELDEVVKYQREHGFKLAWIAPDMRAHKELWEAMTR